MKDKNGIELKVGDFIKNQQQVYKIFGFQEREQYIIIAPKYGITAWINPLDVQKLSDEEAMLYMLVSE